MLEIAKLALDTWRRVKNFLGTLVLQMSGKLVKESTYQSTRIFHIKTLVYTRVFMYSIFSTSMNMEDS
jgi:hypothetical protein